MSQSMWNLSCHTRDQTHAPHSGSWSPNRRTTSEFPFFFKKWGHWSSLCGPPAITCLSFLPRGAPILRLVLSLPYLPPFTTTHFLLSIQVFCIFKSQAKPLTAPVYGNLSCRAFLHSVLERFQGFIFSHCNHPSSMCWAGPCLRQHSSTCWSYKNELHMAPASESSENMLRSFIPSVGEKASLLGEGPTFRSLPQLPHRNQTSHKRSRPWDQKTGSSRRIGSKGEVPVTCQAVCGAIWIYHLI